MTKYNPEIWLESMTRCLKEYVEEQFDKSVRGQAGEPVGLEAYDVIMEFPGPDLDLKVMPMKRTIIHFEIDDIQSQVVGFGDNIFRDSYDLATGLLTQQEAQMHHVNWDVGIWASDASGGGTSRLRAKQILSNALGGAFAVNRLRAFSGLEDGAIEIIRYSGGRFVMDTINDVPIFRMIESTLETRVFSRSPSDEPEYAPAIEEIIQDPHIHIEDEGVLVELTDQVVSGGALPGFVALVVYHGDTWSQVFRFSEGSTPVDLSGATITAAARGSDGISHDLPVTGDSSGIVTLTMPAGGLPAGVYNYDIQVIDTGNVTTTWIRGTLTVEQDVTNGN